MGEKKRKSLDSDMTSARAHMAGSWRGGKAIRPGYQPVYPISGSRNLAEIDWMDIDMWPHEYARAIEEEIGGYKRWLRKCIECRYKLGQLKPHIISTRGRLNLTGPNLGTETSSHRDKSPCAHRHSNPKIFPPGYLQTC